MDKRIISLQATIKLLNERKEMLDKHCYSSGAMSFHAGVSRPQLDHGAISDIETARDHLAAAILFCEDALVQLLPADYSWLSLVSDADKERDSISGKTRAELYADADICEREVSDA